MKKLLCLLLAALMLAAVGCTKPEPETSEVSETSSGVAVHVDYSKLTPYEPLEETYTLHEGYTAGETLCARDDYGALLPYCGKEENAVHTDVDVLHLYGLVTDKGELVTDPIYQSFDYRGGLLVLERPNPACKTDESVAQIFVTLAFPDGSWVQDLTDCRDCCFDEKGYMITASMDNSIDMWDSETGHKAHFDGALFEGYLQSESWYHTDKQWVYCKDEKIAYATCSGGMLYLDLENSEVLDTPPAGYPADYVYEEVGEPNIMDQCPKVEGCEMVDYSTDPFTGKIYFCGIVGDHPYCTLFDADGNMVVEHRRFFNPVYLDVCAGLYSEVEDGRFCYRTLSDGTLKFCYTIQTNSD